MRKSIVPVLALGAVFALFLAAVASAQPGRMHGHGRHGFRGHMDADRLAEALSLTDAQKTQVQQLREKTKAAMGPLFQEHRQLREAVQTALENDANAATVGAAVIAAHEHGEKIRAMRDQHEAELAAILTPEQLERWQTLKESRKRMPPPIPGLGPDGDEGDD